MLGGCNCGGNPAILAGDVSVGVTSPAVAGIVTVDVTSLAVAMVVTIGVATLAAARAASLANAGMAFSADPAGVVTVGVASMADAGMVTVGVTDLADAGATSLADAGMALLADLAGVVTVGVTSLADDGVVTVGVTDLADAGAASLVDPAGIVAGVMTNWNVPAPVEADDLPLLQGCVVRDDLFDDDPEYSNGVMTCGVWVSPDVWCQEMPQTQNDLVCQYVNYVSCDPFGMDYAVPADGYTSSFETLLSGSLCPVTDDMTYYEKIEALGGASYNYDDPVDNLPGYCDYDDPRDYEEWCDWNDPDVAEGYYVFFPARC